MAKRQSSPTEQNCFTIDVEDWYHILDTDEAPALDTWDSLESRVARNVDALLTMLEQTGTRSTMFWLGWVADRHKDLVRRCHAAGHEVASHGYAHVLAYKVGREAFLADVVRAKKTLEDMLGVAVDGYRAPGFGITGKAEWAFDAIREAGHTYDSSVFPASRGHGGIAGAPMHPYVMNTASGLLMEIPNSVVNILGRRLSLFGGGYLRLFPLPMIRWGIRQLHKEGQPLVIYIHPREIDPGHPRIKLPLHRRFKCYVNIKTTLPKLRALGEQFDFITMGELARQTTMLPVAQ